MVLLVSSGLEVDDEELEAWIRPYTAIRTKKVTKPITHGMKAVAFIHIEYPRYFECMVKSSEKAKEK